MSEGNTRPGTNTLVRLYREMLLIRRTEETILDLFAKGKVSGTTHTCLGQEADAVAFMGQLDRKRDHVLSNHRNHGHFLAFGGPPEGLLGEIVGRPEGVCGGDGGSQHLRWGRFYSSGVQGGLVPVSCGIALAEEHCGGGGIVTVCLGDGTMGQGVVYEAMNIASLWKLPVLFLLEDNGIAQTTPREVACAGNLAARAAAFSISVAEISSTDIEKLYPFAAACIEKVREGRRPLVAVVHTIRSGPHSKGDDDRDEHLLARLRERDPLAVAARRLPRERRREAELAVETLIEKTVSGLEIST